MKIRHLILSASLLFGLSVAAQAQISVGVGISTPNLSIGINLPAYPQLVLVPGYPVYYDPRVDFNYFFYDGMYWVYQDDNWYASSWYNGPWELVDPFYVPLFILRVPVRYYRRPPVYFRQWRPDAPPHWGEHWGRNWEERHQGWDRWNHRAAPRPAPLPVYQRQYSGNRYPHSIEQQHAIRSEHYRYQPHDAVARQRFQEQGRSVNGAPGARRETRTIERSTRARDPERAIPQREQQSRHEAPVPQQGVPLPQRQPYEQQHQRPTQREQSIGVPRGERPQIDRSERDRDYPPDQRGRGRENRDEGRGPDRR
jgi:hypothetical protein